ncbi:trimeric LpxA-like protein [Paraphysoderma sedebokerense]|nr:trimeric LpxA-like protein [Paraphysoderma sedebokerense]KAI9144425.1 trimeric LpxA-like protein [Paraphysoderma sedebokerense]
MASHIAKSEKDKMLSGELYNAMEQELLKDRLTAKHLIQKYNNIPIPPSASIETLKQARLEVLDSLLGSYDKSKAPYIEPPFYVDYGYNIHLGQDVYMNHNVVILDVCEVEIGDRTLIGPNVQIYAAAHPVDVETRSTGLEFGKPISIGSDCWVCGT